MENQKENDSDWEDVESWEILKFKIVGDQDICAICLDGMQGTTAVGWVLPCWHKYHLKCIDKSVMAGMISCPLCRPVLNLGHFQGWLPDPS